MTQTEDEAIDHILGSCPAADHKPCWYSEHEDLEDLELGKLQKQALIAYIESKVSEAYRKGYNDNARDCYCEKIGFQPHTHLMDDGKSYNISPFQAQKGKE